MSQQTFLVYSIDSIQVMRELGIHYCYGLAYAWKLHNMLRYVLIWITYWLPWLVDFKRKIGWRSTLSMPKLKIKSGSLSQQKNMNFPNFPIYGKFKRKVKGTLQQSAHLKWKIANWYWQCHIGESCPRAQVYTYAFLMHLYCNQYQSIKASTQTLEVKKISVDNDLWNFGFAK